MPRLNAAAKAVEEEGASISFSTTADGFKVRVESAETGKKIYEGSSVTEAVKKIHGHRSDEEQAVILNQWKTIKAQHLTGKVGNVTQEEIDAQD